MARTLPRKLAWLPALLLMADLCGCRLLQPDPPKGAPETAQLLAEALRTGSLEQVPLAGDAARAILDHAQATSALDGLTPQVSVGKPDYPDRATAILPLDQTYAFPQGNWQFTSNVTLRYQDDRWRVEWTPRVVHPQLTESTRLYHERTSAKRGSILGAGGEAIVEDRPVYRVGIDKTKAPQSQWESSAWALAELVRIDPQGYVDQVAAAGEQAFVLAITLREGQVPAAIDTIPGATALAGMLPLAPTADFARGLLGVAGQATAEIIEASQGGIQDGDVVGLSGLQARYDEQLRGQPGHTISIIGRSPEQLAELPPAAGPSPTAQGTAAPGGGLLFSVAPVAGTPLRLTLDLDIQRKAEQVLAQYGNRLVMVAVLDRRTGGILAAANSPAAQGQFYVDTGRYPPGSTMKVATALALLRRGLTPDSLVDCSETAEVNGRVFRNYNGYPAEFIGQIPLRTALQQSCNTAFMNQARDFAPGELAAAAASLGMGVDFDSGFDAFYGSVPPTDDPVTMAADAIGQGEVLVSPMALAAEAASVGSAQTLAPYLIDGKQPVPDAQPLTAQEAAYLQDMMHAVVTAGTLPQLYGWLDGGKSGTAEYGSDSPPKTHGWAVGYVGDWAICAMDHEQTDSPYIPQFVIQQMLTK